MNRKALNKWALAAMSLLPLTGHALDIDAQDYRLAPLGTNIFLLYGQYANRDAYYAGNDKVNDGELETQIGIARFVHYAEIAGVKIAPQLLIPFGKVKASGDVAALGESSGVLGDVILANTFWLINKSKDKYVGFTPFFSFPTGSYKDENALNIGENRYKTTLQASYLQYWNEKFGTDLTADVTFYGDNKDDVKGTIKQDMGYQLQADVFYNLNPKFTLSAGVSYMDAGDTSVKGVDQDASTQSKIWAGTTYNINQRSNLLMTVGRDIDVENTFKENFRFNFRYVYLF
ncbi:transporter [Acinetobacter sichuanensis]|uniref:transporter n=1 Tax=Acinetobacter sichuanensis TaxID=2136183 RepID=UPI00280D176C|nr:transporter [Acinetobacter sichuanensis]MDQ9019948.1 transporter [Acinetobacter sichuanensis]